MNDVHPIRKDIRTSSGVVGMFSGSPGSWMVTVYLRDEAGRQYVPHQVDAWTDETAKVTYNGECVVDAKDLLGRLVNAKGEVKADLKVKVDSYRGWYGAFTETPFPTPV